MQIVLVLILLRSFALLVLIAFLLISLLVGIILYRLPKAKPVAPVFLFIIPSAAIGAITGGVVIGYLTVRYNEHFIFLGPLGGTIFGGLVGLLVGTGLSGICWVLRKKSGRVR